jgi:hypothetical protein
MKATAIRLALLGSLVTAGLGMAASAHAAGKAEAASYSVELKPMGAYKVGDEGQVELVLNTKSPYHTNKEYPYKFKTAGTDVKYSKDVFVRADGAFEEKRATFKIKFKPTKAGKAKVGGTFYLSSCSEANCVTDKVELDVEIDVK